LLIVCKVSDLYILFRIIYIFAKINNKTIGGINDSITANILENTKEINPVGRVVPFQRELHSSFPPKQGEKWFAIERLLRRGVETVRASRCLRHLPPRGCKNLKIPRLCLASSTIPERVGRFHV